MGQNPAVAAAAYKGVHAVDVQDVDGLRPLSS
jgi:hypothetical protein